ncbi:hypothetical protein VNO77_04470 [Canavalia gladiata]|uniref:Uncharacterized protein n=1 Tax=Canavalia gladiata TaxID=3824 RepID=A0AAN9R937_CANGL
MTKPQLAQDSPTFGSELQRRRAILLRVSGPTIRSVHHEQSSQHRSKRALRRGSDLITASSFNSSGCSSVTEAAYLLLTKPRLTPTMEDESDFRRGPDVDDRYFDGIGRSPPLYLELLVR